MEKTINENAIGVICARFQVAELTSGHKEILEFVLNKNHNQNVIVLGVAPTRATKHNPLDFYSRCKMLEEAYPGKFTILYIKDEPDDKLWSKHLDEMIEDIRSNREVILYGSRDSFINHYHGKFKTEEYEQRVFISGTEQRLNAGKQIKGTKEWRQGCVYATQNRYDIVFPTVDCAIFDDDNLEYVWLAKKEKETKLRFVGGFATPKDNSFEITAKREAQEETNFECSIISFIGSTKIDDWRYASENDKIITSLFAMKRVFGTPKAQDDICELHKVKLSEITKSDLVNEHGVLLDMLNKWKENRK